MPLELSPSAGHPNTEVPSPTISVAMATYNGARFIRQQLDSLAGQTLPPLELVVTDDGSTDETLAILDDFARIAPFPVVIHRNVEQLGYKANFIHCAGLCRGDLIAFCDQDDVWLPGKLATQAKRFDDPSVFLSCHNVRLIDGEGRDLGRTFQQFKATSRFCLADVDPFAFSQGFTQVFRREILVCAPLWPASMDSNAPEEPTAHDQWCFFLAAVFGHVFYDVAVLASYRQHGNNVSGPREQKSAVRGMVEVFLDRRGEYERLTAASRNRAEVLTRLSQWEATRLAAFGPDALDRVQTARRMYEGFRSAAGRRLTVYRDPSMRKRLFTLLDALWNCDYRIGSPWHFTLGGALRDVSMLIR